MGGGASKEQKKKDSKALHENLEKFNPSTMEIFRKLNLTNETLNCLWKTFIEIGRYSDAMLPSSHRPINVFSKQHAEMKTV